MKMADFDYDLPDERIAYTPAGNRSDSKLLVWDQSIIAEAQYKDIAAFIPNGHSLFFNNSKVIAARILFEKSNGLDAEKMKDPNSATNNRQNKIEIFCLEPTAAYTPVQLAMQATNKVTWKCLVGGAKKWKTEFLQKELLYDHISILLSAKKIAQEEGYFIIEFSWDHPSIVFSEIIALVGQIPLPPYIQRAANETDKDRYQTTYATTEGSVAAPTAGLHFDEHVFKSLFEKGIEKKFITLHVGAGTFMPVKVDDFQDHLMHAEFIDVTIQTIEYLASSSDNVIAVGTTSFKYKTLSEYANIVEHLLQITQPSGCAVVCLPKLHLIYHRLRYQHKDLPSELSKIISGSIVDSIELDHDFYLKIQK
jgi:S-adenosylmethionine:tRNA ribosyltransferase-isomerase